ncbi:MAG TPA: outer membrane beta-barrel protein [Mucilaginibacter sp.]|nr:outer membrane beta-barrel protein [Mucilaginibacter sp.]
MKNFISYLLLALFLPLFASSQSNYKPGYVVKLNGDTVRGFIDYREWEFNPDAISFKQSIADEAAKTYGVNDIKYFNVEGLDSFILFNGIITADSTDPDKVTQMGADERDTTVKAATIFLRVLEKGNRLALYSYRDELKTRFFVAESPDYTPKELIFRYKRFEAENTFRKQLSAEAYKYNELNGKLEVYIAKADYTLDDILDIVNRINHISKADYAKTHYKGSPVDIFVGGAVNVNTISPSSDAPFVAAGGGSNTSYLPAFFAGLKFFANPATKRLQLRLELSDALSSYKSLYTAKVYPYKPTEASFNANALSASLQIIYNFYNATDFKVYGGVGFEISSYSFTNSYLGTQNHDGSESDIAANDPYFFVHQNTTFLLKTGVQLSNHFEVFANYLINNNVTEGGYFQLSANAIQAGVLYSFNLK